MRTLNTQCSASVRVSVIGLVYIHYFILQLGELALTLKHREFEVQYHVLNTPALTTTLSFMCCVYAQNARVEASIHILLFIVFTKCFTCSSSVFYMF